MCERFKPILWDDIDVETSTTRPLLRCGMKEMRRSESGGLCMWPMRRITTSQRLSGLNPLQATEEARAWTDACRLWNEVCGIHLVWSEEFDSANIWAHPGSMGSGTLAWSYLPCGADETDRMEQQYNQSVRWSYALLMDTMAHEIGHAIGLDHNTSDPASIMRPYSNGQLGKLSQSDIDEVVKRYGEPDGNEDPGEPPNEIFGTFEMRVGSEVVKGIMLGSK